MNIKNIIKGENVEQELLKIIDNFHKKGPTNPYLLEKLSYIKIFHPSIFNKYESQTHQIIYKYHEYLYTQTLKTA